MTDSNALARRSTYLYLLALGIVSAHFSVAYVTGTSPYVDVAEYTAGSERLPYQYRALTSWILNLLVRLEGLHGIAASQRAPFDKPEILALTLLNVPAVMLATDITRRSIGIFVGNRTHAAILSFLFPVSLYLTYAAQANTHRLSFAYDIPNMPLFALGVFAVLSRRQVLFYLTFLVATLSREISIFLVFMLALYNLSAGRRVTVRIGVHCLALGVIWLSVKAFLAWLYDGNPIEHGAVAGGMFQLWPRYNIGLWTSPKYWPSLLSIFGFLWLAVLAGWRYIGNADLRRTLWVIPIWLAAMFMVARMNEVRLFGELTTLLSVMTAVIVSNYFSRRESRSFPEGSPVSGAKTAD